MNKKNLLYIPFMLLPLIVTLIALQYMPSVIPTHYGINGKADSWGSKYQSLIMPVLTIVICGTFIPLMNYISKKSKNADKQSIKILTATNIGMIAIFNVLSYVFLYTAINKVENFGGSFSSRIPMIAVGILFLVMGIFMPKAKQGTGNGVRTRATRSDAEIWTKTQKIAGTSLVIFSLIYIPIAIFIPFSVSFVVFIVGVSISSIYPTVYANKLYKEKFGDKKD